MLKQQHYTLTNVKKVKSQSTTPLNIFFVKGLFEVKATILHRPCESVERNPEHKTLMKVPLIHDGVSVFMWHLGKLVKLFVYVLLKELFFISDFLF